MPRFDCSTPDEYSRGIDVASRVLEDGKLAVVPTDTLYGIAADAFNPDAVAALLAAKHRGPDMPVPVLVPEFSTVDGLIAHRTLMLNTLMKAFWPGGLSIIVPQAPSLPWNIGQTGGTVLIRMPAHPLTLRLLEKTGPLAVSSANLTGQTPASTIEEAEEQFGSSVQVYLDGGKTPQGTASTIIDLSTPTPHIVREGAITAQELSEVMGISASLLREEH